MRAQLCLPLCNSIDCSPLGSTVHAIFQVRILEWVDTSFYRGSSQTRDPTHISCIGRRVLYHCTTWEAQKVTVFSVTKSCPILCNPMDCSKPCFPLLRYLPEFAQIHVHASVMLSNHLILCHTLFLLSSIFPSIRIFFRVGSLHQLVLELHSISPSNEYSGFRSLRIDWFDLLATIIQLKK